MEIWKWIALRYLFIFLSISKICQHPYNTNFYCGEIFPPSLVERKLKSGVQNSIVALAYFLCVAEEYFSSFKELRPSPSLENGCMRPQVIFTPCIDVCWNDGTDWRILGLGHEFSQFYLDQDLWCCHIFFQPSGSSINPSIALSFAKNISTEA
jgi:hypothetical protein